MNARSKWVNVFKTAYFFGQGPSCRPATRTKKINPQWQVPKCIRYRRYSRQRAAVSRSTICLLGVGFSLRQVVFVHLVYFYQDCTMILAHVLIIFLLLWGCKNRTMFFWMKCPSFTRFWWLYEWVPTWTCIFVAAPIMTKSVACSQDGATNWTEVLSIITCLCNYKYIYSLYPHWKGGAVSRNHKMFRTHLRYTSAYYPWLSKTCENSPPDEHAKNTPNRTHF